MLVVGSSSTLQSAQYCFRVEFENCPLPTLTLPPNVQQVPFKTLNVTSGERKSPQEQQVGPQVQSSRLLARAFLALCFDAASFSSPSLPFPLFPITIA